ncbi:MAG: methionine--tRNA ligase, partial [Gemmatimonadota bacterium]
GFVQPESRRNEIRRVLEGGLEDISVSRAALPWGVPWPDDPGQTVYVWLDALTNYLSAVGFPDDGYRAYWPCDVHVIGKDITRFHCIYWPAFLLSAGVELPRTVWAHGFVTYGGRKLSKSEGVTFELPDAIARHGPDSLRYYLVREVPWDGDGDITGERFDERYTTELANELGNLASRSLSMVERYRDGVVPEGRPTSLDDALGQAVESYRTAMEEGLLHRGVQASRELAVAANGFVEERAPWSQARDPERARELDDTLAALVRALAALSALLHPVMPSRMADLATRVGLETCPTLDELGELELAGRRVDKGAPLFPREDLA